jgi:hypothetical protein
VLALAASLVLGGCRGVEAMKQRCVAGDVSACESACGKGIVGEGGCFHAGDQHRQRAGLDVGSDAWRRARGFFVKSCDGRYGDGCLFLAQMVEAPYAPIDAEQSGKEAPKTISDAEVLEREKRLSLACDAASRAGCKRLGDVLIGKNAARAVDAYGKACQTGPEVEACKAARTREVDIAERWRTGCTRGIADDCSRLGDLLFAVDPPRAGRLFVSECQLRGVTELAGGVGRFVRDRVLEAKRGIPAFVDPSAPAPRGGPPDAPSVDVLPVTVSGQVAIVEVDRMLRAHVPDLTTCVARLPKTARGTVGGQLIVDLTGDVWRATLTATGLPGDVSTCMQSALEALALSSPGGGTATVAITIAIGAAPPPSTAPR